MTLLSHHQSSFENLKAHSGTCQEIQSQRSITKLGPNPSQINQVWEKAASCRLEKNAGLDSTHLSAKMMAHVLCGNERILGTHLEGNTFTNSLEYAQRHLQRFGDGVYQLDGSDGEKQKAHTMAKEIQDCCLLKKEIGSMNTASLAAEKLPVLVSKLSEQINGLKTSERMLLPGGWISKEGSHAMLYEIEKRADGHLHFHLFNTGDGLSNHPHKYIKDSTEPRYLCHLEWNLGSHENAEKSLGSVLHDLLAMTLPSSVERPSNEAGADQIYKTILPKMEASGAKKVPHESDGSGWRKAQKAGVCTWEWRC